MKKIILISLGVLVLIIGGISLYMSFLDWNEHKGRIAMQFSSVVGENIEFGGDLKVSLFPHPKMSAKSVSVVNPQTGETLATVKQLNMDVTLSSVLRGVPDIQSLTVDGVELWLKFDEDGKSNWARQVAPQQSALNDVRVQILYVRNGLVHIQNKTYGLAADLNDFAAEIQAEFLDSGPYQIAGNFIYEGERYGLALSIDSMLQLDDVGFHFGLRHPSTEGKFVYDGIYNKQTGLIKGSLSGEFTQTALVIDRFFQKDILSEQYNVPMQFSAKEFDIESDKINLSGFTIKFEPYFVGTGDLSFSRKFVGEQPKAFNLKYQIVDMDLRSGIKRFEEKFKQYAREVYIPDNSWDGNFEITAGRVRISDNDAGFLSNVGLKGSWRDNTLNIDDFYADAQGDVDLTCTGTISPQNDMPEVMLTVAAQGEDIKTFFNALNIDLRAPMPNAYRKAKLDADFKANPKEWRFDNAYLKLDNADINGQLYVSLTQNKYQLNAETNNLNFDTYIFPLEKEDAQDMFSILRHDAKVISGLKNNIEVAVRMTNSTFRGVPVKEAAVRAFYENAELAIENFSLKDFIGTSIDGAGAFKNLNTNLPDIETLSFSAKSQNLKGLTDKWGIVLPKWSLFGLPDVSVAATISGNYEAIQAKAEVVSEGDVFAYEGTLSQKDGRLYFDGVVDVKSPKMENMLSKVNIKAKDSKVFRGVFNAHSQIEGNSGNYQLTDADFKIGSTNYKGDLEVKKPSDKYVINGQLKASDLNFAQFFGAQKVAARNVVVNKAENTFFARPNLGKAAFDFSAYNAVDFDIKLSADKGFYENFSLSDFRGRVVNGAQQLNIRDADFKVGATSVRGNVLIDYSQTPRISGNISIDKWPIKKAGGSVYAVSAGNINLTGNFEGTVSSLEDLIGSLSGKLTLQTQDVLIYGINLGAIAEDLKLREYSKGLYQVVQKNLQSGSTKFMPMVLNIPLQNGIIALDGIALHNIDTNAVLNGKVNLRDWRIGAEVLVKYKNLPKVEAYKFALNGALNNPALDVSVDNIVRAYDEHWQKVAASEKARKDEVARVLNEHMNKVQTQVALVAEKHAAAVALIDKYSHKNLAPETAQLYVKQNQRLDEIGRLIQSMQNKARQADFTESDIADIQKQAEVLKKEIDEIGQEVNEYFSDDLQQAMIEVGERVAQLQSQYGGIYDSFKQMFDDDRKQLQMINAEKYLTDNVALQQYQAGMESYHNSVMQEIGDFNKKYEEAKEMSDGSDKLAAVHALSTVPALLEEKYKQMQEIHRSAAELLLNVVNQRQEAYKMEQLAQEKKRRKEAAENAGNLLLENIDPYYTSTKEDDGEKDLIENKKGEIGAESGIIKKVISPADYRTLLPLENGQIVPTGGGILIRSTDRPLPYAEPNFLPQLLTPIEGETPEPSGYIIVR